MVPNRRRHILENVHGIQQVVDFQLTPIWKLEKYGIPEQIQVETGGKVVSNTRQTVWQTRVNHWEKFAVNMRQTHVQQ
jgi:hypothetical protein